MRRLYVTARITCNKNAPGWCAGTRQLRDRRPRWPDAPNVRFSHPPWV